MAPRRTRRATPFADSHTPTPRPARAAAWAWRAFVDRDPRRATHRSWQVFAVVSCVCLVAAMTFSRYWQGQIRLRMGVAPDGLSSLLVTPLLAALVFVALIVLLIVVAL